MTTFLSTVSSQSTQSQIAGPSVTLILPIRNEAAHIGRSLAAILAQDYPPERMEILVVDGLSDDGTREIISQFTIHNSLFIFSTTRNGSLLLP